MTRYEIDSFPESNDLTETMEVKGIIYTRVVNPQAALDPLAPPAIWVPGQVYQSGKYTAYTANLPKAATVAAADNDLTDNTAAAMQPADRNNNLIAENSSEEQLTEATPKIPILRRRALLFPTITSRLHPEIVTLLSLEFENKLPLRIADCHDQTLLKKGRLLKQRGEISANIKKWLQRSSEPPEVQFILFLTAKTGRKYQYYTCTWIDSQTGDNVASFTFRADLKGNLLRPLVPNDPVPLARLIDSTNWWCRISSGAQENIFQLDAGHRSDLQQGRELQVFRRSTQINDPRNKQKLGFFFTEPIGLVTVVDFYGADGSLAQARTPLTGDFNQAYAVMIIEAEENPKP
ncbi:MAG: hypothetical protein J7M09_05755 [Deltaproteobacteria bacterium]|nr:hypothetical protein [Candidatus Tharpella sp.]